MIRLATIVIALLALATPALAGVPQHPGRQHSVFASHMVCSQGAHFKTASVPTVHTLIDVTVNGHHVLGYSVNRLTVEWAGHGVLVHASQSKGRGPVTVHAASVRSDCARVNLLITWR